MSIAYMHPADQLLAVMKRIYTKGMTTTSGGNLSIKDADGNVWITPASIDKGTLTRRDIVCVKPSGEIVGIHKPSSELPFHQSVYRRRPDIHAVLHAHPPGLVAFSIARKLPHLEMLPRTKSICGDIALAEYAVPGSEKLGENIARYFDKGYNVVFLENHGVCIGDDTIFEAFRKFETLEFACNVEIEAHRIGRLATLGAERLALADEFCPARMPEYTPALHTPEELAARRDMIPFLRRIYDQNLAIPTMCSLSVRLSDGSLLITPQKADGFDVEPEELVLVKDGMREAGKVPSDTVRFHEAVYRENPTVNAFVVAQPRYATAFAVTDAVFDARTIPESYLLLRDIRKADAAVCYNDPTAAAKSFSNPVPAVIFRNDSIAVTGGSLLQVFDRLEVAEATAHSIIISADVGEVVHIHDDEVEEIKTVFNLQD